MQLITKDGYEDVNESASVVYCYDCSILNGRQCGHALSVGFETDDAEVLYCAGCNTDLSVGIDG